MIFKVIEGHSYWHHSIIACKILLVLYGNYVTILHRIRDVTSYTEYVTAFDLEKFFSFHTYVKIIGQLRLLIRR